MILLTIKIREKRLFFVSDYQTGDYLEIDNDNTKYWDIGDVSFSTGTVRKVSSSSEIVSRNNNSLSISQSQSLGAIQMLNRAIDSDERNRYTASIEVDPRTGNTIYKLSGERK